MIIAHPDLASEKRLGRYRTDYTCIDKNGLSKPSPNGRPTLV